MFDFMSKIEWSNTILSERSNKTTGPTFSILSIMNEVKISVVAKMKNTGI